MTTSRYKSDVADRDVVLKSAFFGMMSGFLIVLPSAIVIVGASITGDYGRDEIRMAILFLPALHVMVFVVVTITLVSLYMIVRGHTPPTPPAEAQKKSVK